ncbi:MAG: hypothetical protein V2J65_05215 [Desulfobacteraceae bacterium]|jgi:hypothetical protein|nr:hypothetical protein [Desulfobacteraceae bacterium]
MFIFLDTETTSTGPEDRLCQIALALLPGPVVADIPNNLADIVYQDFGWDSDQLRIRGYTIINPAIIEKKSSSTGGTIPPTLA